MPEKLGKSLLIDRTNPDELRPIYINDAILTHSNEAFFMTLSQMEAPALLDSSELDHLTKIESIAVAKLVMSPEFVKVLIDTLNENYSKYLARTEKHESQE